MSGFLLSMPLIAQLDLAKMEIVGTPVLSETEIVARRLPDGRYCAGLRIISELDNFSYDAEIGIVKYIDNPGEDILYLDPNNRYITAYHVGYEPLKIILSEFGIQLREREMWNLEIRGGVVDILPVSFIIEPADAELRINNEIMEGGPTFQLKTNIYYIEVRKEGYYTRRDTIQVTLNDVIFEYYLGKIPEMVFVGEGRFDLFHVYDLLGLSPPEEWPIVESFQIGKYEVTFNEFDTFCKNIGKNLPFDNSWGRGDQPVIYVSWYDAVEYCNWLSLKAGLKPYYVIDKTRLDSVTNDSDYLKWTVVYDSSATGYRLPTLEEWQYACSGGKHSKNYKYSGSNNPNRVAWYKDNSESRTHPIGLKKANELGLYDMSGNVEEWCQDRRPYTSFSGWGDKIIGELIDRAAIGGHFGSTEQYIENNPSYYAEYHGPGGNPATTISESLGFRLCRSSIENKDDSN